MRALKIHPKRLAILSHAAYEPPADERSIAASIGYEVVQKIDHNGTQASLYAKPVGSTPPVLAFRGTEFMKSWTDFFRNVGRSADWVGPGQVHSGYWRGLSMVIDDVQRLSEQFPDLVITGHSLGGSTATLATAFLKFECGSVHECASFGAPPVLGKEIAGDIEVDRFVIANDFAPMVPGWMVGLRHTERKIALPAHGWKPAAVSAHWVPLYVEKLDQWSGT